jgi:DNA-binding transcriptional LysR family regulator
VAEVNFGRLAPQLSFQKLELFCHVASLRSVTRAAERLGVAQPAVTAHLRDLEEKLGVRLVYRDGRNLGLTEAGLRFHRWCEETLTRCAELARELSGLSGGTRGSAIIAASMSAGSYLLADMLVKYQKQFPSTSVIAQISNTPTATEAVRTGACDFGVLLLDREQGLEGLEFELLRDERLLMVGAPEDDRVGAMAAPSEVAQLPFIASPPFILRRNLEDEMLYSCGVLTRNIVMELGHPEAIKRVVRQKTGFAFIEESAVREELGRGELRAVQTPEIDMRMPLYMAHRRGKSPSEMQIGLMEFLRQAFKSM